MNNSEAINSLKPHIKDYLQDKGINVRRNFICLNPQHHETNPSMSLFEDADKVHCFGCNASYDIFDLIGIDYNLTDFQSKINKASELFNVNIGTGRPKTLKELATETIGSKSVPEVDYSEFILKAHEHISETDYPQQRGLTEKTINRFKLGYAPEWKPPKTPNAPSSARLIIPDIFTGKGYLARAIDNSVASEFQKQKTGTVGLFNWQVLGAQLEHIFIVEGEIDAMSLIELGHEAIGLASVSNAKKLLAKIKDIQGKSSANDYFSGKTFYILLDNDKAGITASKELASGLKGLNCRYHVLKLPEYKDPNEALKADRGQLNAILDDMVANPTKYQYKSEEIDAVMQTAGATDADSAKFLEARLDQLKAEIANHNLAIEDINSDDLQVLSEDERKQAYDNASPLHHLQKFTDGITESISTPATSTGFENMDKVLDGGLYAGLYIIGAISSLGKTTFTLQIADQIAQNGERDILIFSLEMSRAEIMAKTISRLTMETALETLSDDEISKNARTVRQITDGRRYKGYTDVHGITHPPYTKTQLTLIQESIKRYERYAGNLFIHEGSGNIGVQQVRSTIENYVATHDGKAPVILIDYLQILAPYDMKATDKQNTDKAVLELKRISRDFNVPVIAISSFNRENYSNAVSMASFKESGAIEYSSDVLIGLQFKKQREIDVKNATKKANEPRLIVDADQEKAKNPREVEMKILKNRNGQTGLSVDFNFYAQFNYFEDLKIYNPNQKYTFDMPNVSNANVKQF